MKSLLKRLKKYDNNLIWVFFLVLLVYILCSGILEGYGLYVLLDKFEWSSAMYFIHDYYSHTIISVLILVAYCLIFPKNRFILRSFLPAGKGLEHEVRVVEDSYVPSQNNTAKTLLLGLLIGFVTNFFCIACALVHGDIRLYFDFSAAQLPTLVFAFLMVFVQSASEEMWLRGFMYERLNIRYPLWMAVVVNGALFGLLHMFNEGATALSVILLIIVGIAYSLVRWYSGSMWMMFGMHAMWNFTQNFIFGLPNSGLVSEFSVFHLDAANGVTNLIYDYDFGVEGGIPALITSIALAGTALLLAKRAGRLGELRMSYQKKAALEAAAE